MLSRFPPWTTEDNGACLIVKDRNGQAITYVYYEREPGRRAAGESGSAPARIIARGRAHQALHVGLDQPETDITIKFLPTLV